MFEYQRGSPAIEARYQLVSRLVPAWESQPESGANWQLRPAWESRP